MSLSNFRVSAAIAGLALAVTATAPANADPSANSGPWQVSQVDSLMADSLSNFLDVRQRRPNYVQHLDWSTDGCSKPARGTGLTFDFQNACIRHDFGYRNYKKLNVFTKSKKAWVDTIFYTDMKNHCATRSFALKPGCYAAAKRYYKAVDWFGN